MAEHTVYAVASGKGGVGKTTTTVNLGAALAEQGHSVVLVDVDLGMANLGGYLGVGESGRTLHEVLGGEAALDDAVYEVGDGLAVVPSGVSLDGFADVETDALSDAVDALEGAFDYVLLDLGAGLSHDSVLPLALADAVLLVSTPDPMALTDTAKTREITERLGGALAGTVLTRAGPSADLDLADAEDELGIPVLAAIPEDRAVQAGADEQRPVVGHVDSPAAEGYRGLADIIVEESLAKAPVVPEPPSEPAETAAPGTAPAADEADPSGDEDATDRPQTEPDEPAVSSGADPTRTEADAEPASVDAEPEPEPEPEPDAAPSEAGTSDVPDRAADADATADTADATADTDERAAGAADATGAESETGAPASAAPPSDEDTGGSDLEPDLDFTPEASADEAAVEPAEGQSDRESATDEMGAEVRSDRESATDEPRAAGTDDRGEEPATSDTAESPPDLREEQDDPLDLSADPPGGRSAESPSPDDLDAPLGGDTDGAASGSADPAGGPTDAGDPTDEPAPEPDTDSTAEEIASAIESAADDGADDEGDDALSFDSQPEASYQPDTERGLRFDPEEDETTAADESDDESVPAPEEPAFVVEGTDEDDEDDEDDDSGLLGRLFGG